MFRKIFKLSLIMVLISTLLLACAKKPASDSKVYELTFYSSWPEKDDLAKPIFRYKDMLEKESNGRLKLTFKGGPEAIPPFESGNAIKTGITDIALTATAYYSSILSEALVFDYASIPVEKQRANGGFEYVNQLHEQKMNTHLLALVTGRQYQFYMKDKIEQIADFKGKTVRSSDTYTPVVNALGLKFANLPGPEIYSALERNVVTGLAWADKGISSLRLQEQLKYVIQPPFLSAVPVILINLDKWKALPKDLQDVITKVSIQFEKDNVAYEKELAKTELDILTKAGMQIITLKDGEEYLKLINKAVWEWFPKRVGSNGAKLKEFFFKE